MGNNSGKSRRVETLERENTQQQLKIVVLEKTVKDIGKEMKRVKEKSDMMAGQLKNIEIHDFSKEQTAMKAAAYIGGISASQLHASHVNRQTPVYGGLAFSASEL